MIPHLCHWPTCNKKVPPGQWACLKHWALLPTHLRRRIDRAYRCGRPSLEYSEVAKIAAEWCRAYIATEKIR